VGHESARAGATAAAAAAAAEPIRATLRLEAEVCASSPAAAHLTTRCLERDTAGTAPIALRWVFDTRLLTERGGNTVVSVIASKQDKAPDRLISWVGVGDVEVGCRGRGGRGTRTGWKRRRGRRWERRW
jgi:hypothetical protein